MSPDSEPHSGPIRVLAVASTEGFSLPGAERLREKGFEIETARNPYAAVARFAREPAEMVVVELDGLESSELELIRVLRELKGDAFILAVFSQLHRAKAAEALKMGADGCLLQPFYPQELSELLGRWAQRRTVQQETGQHYRRHLASLARLAKGTAHEINNPLTTLAGWLEMMAAQEERPDSERRRLSSMQEEAERIAAVVQRLLEFGQEQPEQRGPVDLNQLLARQAKQLSSTWGKQADLKVRLDADSAVVWGDEEQLGRACRLLLEDAVAALNGQGTVNVSTGVSEQGDVELRVQDNGRLIEGAGGEEIFEPFAVVPRAGERMSLAYPAVYGIVKNHGGHIRVVSDQEHGTEFVLRLPRISAEP